MADSTPKSYHTDPTLWLYTSLTAGSSQIITATARLEGILKANKIPFQALDVATDEKARMLWGRRAGKRKLPGLVRMGMIVGDFEEVVEWNEFGELRENVGDVGSTATPTPSAINTPSKPPIPSSIQPSASASSSSTETPPRQPTSSSTSTSTTSSNPLNLTMRQASAEAAQKASLSKSHPKSNLSGPPSKFSATELSPSSSSASPLSKLSNSLATPTSLPSSTGTISPASPSPSPAPSITTPPSRAEHISFAPGTAAGISDSAATSTTSLRVVDGSEEAGGGEYTKHRGSSISAASAKEIKSVENKWAIPEEEEAETDETLSKRTGKEADKGNQKATALASGEGTAKTDEAQDLPGSATKTQDQGAADAGSVGASVAD